MLSRREMGALCAALLLCLLLSLGAGWAKGQLDAADALAADTLRLHIRADTNAVRDQSAKLAVRDAVLALADESCPADGKADAKVWAASNLVRLELTAREVLAAPTHRCTPASSICISPPGATQEQPCPPDGTMQCGWTSGLTGRAATGGVCSTRASAGRPAAGMHGPKKTTSSAESTSCGSGWWSGGAKSPPPGRMQCWPGERSAPTPHRIGAEGV